MSILGHSPYWKWNNRTSELSQYEELVDEVEISDGVGEF